MRASSITNFDRREYQRKIQDAESLQNRGKYAEAAALLRQNLASSTQHLGVRHSATLDDQDSLSDCLHDLGEYAEAAALDRSTLQIRKRNDEKSQETLATQYSLANNLSQLGQYKDSIALYRSVVAHRKEVLGENDNDTLATRHQLAYNLHRHGQDKEASQINKQILELREGRLAPDDYDLIASRHNLAINLHALENLEKAMALTNQNLVLLRCYRPAADGQLREVERLQERIDFDILALKRSKKASQEKEEADIERPGKVETAPTKGEVPSMIVASNPPARTSSQTPRPTSTQGKKTADGKTGESSSGKSRIIETPLKKNKSPSMTVPPTPVADTSPRPPPPTSSHSKKTEGTYQNRSFTQVLVSRLSGSIAHIRLKQSRR